MQEFNICWKVVYSVFKITDCVSISAFVSLVCVRVGITSKHLCSHCKNQKEKRRKSMIN